MNEKVNVLLNRTATASVMSRHDRQETAEEENLFHEIPLKNRSQAWNSRIRRWVKRNKKTGRFNAVKKDGKPYRRIEPELWKKTTGYPLVLRGRF
jgi:hypothetical protein